MAAIMIVKNNNILGNLFDLYKHIEQIQEIVNLYIEKGEKAIIAKVRKDFREDFESPTIIKLMS